MKTARTCGFNSAFRVDTGQMGDLSLSDARFWLAGGRAVVAEGRAELWGAVTFDPAVSVAQRAALLTVIHALFGDAWSTFSVTAAATVDWELTASRARARLAGGTAAEVELTFAQADVSAADAAAGSVTVCAGVGAGTGGVRASGGTQVYRFAGKLLDEPVETGRIVKVDASSEDAAAR